MTNHFLATRLRRRLEVPRPGRGADGKPLLALVVAKPEHSLLQSVVGHRRKQSSLLGNAEIGKGRVDLKLRFCTAEPNIRGLAEKFPATAQGCGHKAKGVDGITFATIVLADKYRQIFGKADALVLERSEVVQS